jgi:predicted dehydrogenase
MTTNIAIVGAGYWGPNLIRNFAQLSHEGVCRLYAVCDTDPNSLRKVGTSYPDIALTPHYEELLNDPQVDAVVIATPAALHYTMARQALLADKHILVEKPLAMSSAEAEELIDLARQRRQVLMVGHVFLFSPSVIELKEILDSGELGEIYYAYATRLNLGRFRSDVNALWNLAPHDISILNYLFGKEPEVVAAAGRAYLQPSVEDVAFVALKYHPQVLAHVHVSWLNPRKVRAMTIVGSRKMVVYDDVSSETPITIYNKGADRVNAKGEVSSFGEYRLKIRFGEIYSPMVPVYEPLRRECEHFLACIEDGAVPKTDGQNGLAVIRVLERATEMLTADTTLPAWEHL